jgi:hypothetical protein
MQDYTPYASRQYVERKGSGTEDEEMAVQVDLDTRGLRAKTPSGFNVDERER